MEGLEFSLLGWVVLGICALLVGIAKTSIGGLGVLAVAGFALFIPARESTAAVLLVLIIGDLVAVALYRHSTDWAMVRGLLPAVVPGIALGALVMAFVDDRTMTVLIAGVILVALTIQVIMRRRTVVAAPGPASDHGSAAAPDPATPSNDAPAASTVPGPYRPPPQEPPVPGKPHLLATAGTGLAAGFTTMVANAAGPVMTLYLLAVRAEKMRFVGTMASYFLIINLAKVPFSIGLGLMTTQTLWLTLVLAPVVLVGTWLGRRFLGWVPQRRFEQLALGAALLAGLVLLVRALV